MTPLLIDTATLLRLQLERWELPEDELPRDSFVIESLVLYDWVILDGPSVAYNRQFLNWTADLDDGVEIFTPDAAERARLYRRIAEMFESVADSEIRPGAELLPVSELGGDDMPSYPWTMVIAELDRYPESGPVLSEIKNRVHGRAYRVAQLTTLATLMRLFHYLALQQTVGANLLLDRQKAPDQDVPRYGFTSSIMENFTGEVRARYAQRRRRWLGESVPELPVPALSRYVSSVAQERGWSLGRAVTWLREQPEVVSYRAGMTELVGRLQAGDAAGADEIFVELDGAAERWSARLGAPAARRRVPVTLALPLVEAMVPLPVPRLRRTPGEKLLLLIDVLLSTE
ncbi:hypothetical protein [Actinoplanes sp. GCM10030250]|uniref:hypothetical protein n=1 Tax=Actinoplanes sp. GCM10030250 TaxID=3273376 RepID=UPI003614D291